MNRSISNHSSFSSLSPGDRSSPSPTENVQEKNTATPPSFQGERLSVTNSERQEQHQMRPISAVPAPGNSEAVIERGRIRQVFHDATRPFVSLRNITGVLATRAYRGLSSFLNPQNVPRVAVTSQEEPHYERERPSTPRATPVEASAIPTATGEPYVAEIYPPGPLREAFDHARDADLLRGELEQAMNLSPLSRDPILARSVHSQLENLTNALNTVALHIRNLDNQHDRTSQHQAINNLLRARQQLSEEMSSSEIMLDSLSMVID